MEKTQEALTTALDFVKTLAEKNGVILFIGGKNESIGAVTSVASGINMPYVAGRFIGKFDQLSGNQKTSGKNGITHFAKRKRRALKYTKKGAT